MGTKYQIWNKTDPVITPIGEYLTPEKWIERYPAAAHLPFVIAVGTINGAFCSSLPQLEAVYWGRGCDFSECVSNADKLTAIEAFDEAQKAIVEEKAIEAGIQAQSLATIAANLEYANLLTLEDVGV
jgi:hypothetical protein